MRNSIFILVHPFGYIAKYCRCYWWYCVVLLKLYIVRAKFSIVCFVIVLFPEKKLFVGAIFILLL